MITADVRMVDLEPEGFGRLAAILARRVYAPAPELQVLHRNGEVLAAVHPDDGLVEGMATRPFTDVDRRAAELLALTGVARVTMLDTDGLEDLVGEVNELAVPGRSQWELLWLARELWWTHPAVVTVPEPPEAPAWRRVVAWSRRRDADWWAVVGAWEGDELALSVIAHVGMDGIDVLTSADHFGPYRPPRSRAVELVERVARQGRVGAALLCDLADLERVVDSADPIVELARVVGEGRVLHHEGIEDLW